MSDAEPSDVCHAAHIRHRRRQRRRPAPRPQSPHPPPARACARSCSPARPPAASCCSPPEPSPPCSFALLCPALAASFCRRLTRTAGSLVLIASSGSPDPATPSIHVSDYREWTTNTAPLFSELAFYRVTDKTLHLADGPERRLVVAQASPNLLHLLGIWPPRPDTTVPPSTSPAPPGRRAISAILTSSDVRRTSTARPSPSPASCPPTPGAFPAPSTPSSSKAPPLLAQLAPTARGFAIARIRGSVFPPPRDGSRFMVETRFGVVYHFDCISLPHLLGQPLSNVLLVLFLACIALPATLPLSLSEAPVRRGTMPRGTFLRRTAFLAAKLALVPPLVLLCSIALTWGPAFSPNTAFLDPVPHRRANPAFRVSLDPSRPAPPLPGVSPPALQSRPRRTSLLQFPRLERHRARSASAATDCCTFPSCRPAGSAPSAGSRSTPRGSASSRIHPPLRRNPSDTTGLCRTPNRPVRRTTPARTRLRPRASLH